MSAEAHTLTGAYALDALDPDERVEFERHVAVCPDCAREVAELRATSARLGRAVALTPPPGLRQQVMAHVVRTRQDSPHGLRFSDSDQRASRRNWITWTASIAAAIALLAAGTIAGVAVNADSQLHQAQAQLNQAQARYAPVAQLLAAPDVRTATDSIDGGSATVLISRTLGKVVLVTTNLPNQPGDRTYQAWGISQSGVHSLGLLGNGGSTTLTPHLGHAGTIGITVEPAGGSAHPTTIPIMSVPVPQ